MRFTIFLFGSVPFRFILFPFQFRCVVLIRISLFMYKVTPAKSFANIFEIPKKSKFSRFELPCIKPEDHTAKKDLTHFIVNYICSKKPSKANDSNKESANEWRSEIIFMFTVYSHSSSFSYVQSSASVVLGARYVFGGVINLYWAKCAYEIHTI